MTTSNVHAFDIEEILNKFTSWEKNIVKYSSINIDFNNVTQLRNSISRKKYEKTLMDVRTYRLALVLVATSTPYTLGKLAYMLGGYTQAQRSTLKDTLKRTLQRMEVYGLVTFEYEKNDCYKIQANKKLIDFFLKNQ